MTRLRLILKPYKDQFDRSPWYIKALSLLCVMYLSVPIDPFDILFPWAAFSDDLFIAGILLKMLHKHGGLPEEEKITAMELLKTLFGKDADTKKSVMTDEQMSLSAKVFLDEVCKDCGGKWHTADS